jgi:hypothetical protein
MLRTMPVCCVIVVLVLATACQTQVSDSAPANDASGLVSANNTLNEAPVLSTLQLITRSQVAYSASSGGPFGSFEQLANGGLLDSRFAAEKPQLHGYVFTMNISSATDGSAFFSCNADPSATSDRPGRHFYVDSSSPKVHVNPSSRASATDPAVD